MVLNNDTREAIFVILDYFTNRKGNENELDVDGLKDSLKEYVDDQLPSTKVETAVADDTVEKSYFKQPVEIECEMPNKQVEEIIEAIRGYTLNPNTGEWEKLEMKEEKDDTPKKALRGQAMHKYRKEHPEEEFIFKNTGNPLEYTLKGKKIYIKGNIHSKKPLPLTIESVYSLKRLMEDKIVFTNQLWFECKDYLKKHEPKMNRQYYQKYLGRIWRGDFDNVIKEYRESLKVKMNPQFNVNRGKLVVDNVNTNLSLETVNKILDNIPADAGKLDDYTTKTINRYLRCPESSIRTIINNYDNYSLLKILKRKTNKRNDLHYGWK